MPSLREGGGLQAYPARPAGAGSAATRRRLSVTAETPVLDTLADLTADVLHGLYSGGAS